MALLIALLLAYAGFSALCSISRRSLPVVWPSAPGPGTVWALRIAGFLLLALSWVPCHYFWLGYTSHWSVATIGWLCVMSTAALLLTLWFAYRSRHSVIAGVFAAVLAAILTVHR